MRYSHATQKLLEKEAFYNTRSQALGSRVFLFLLPDRSGYNFNGVSEYTSEVIPLHPTANAATSIRHVPRVPQVDNKPIERLLVHSRVMNSMTATIG